MKEAIVTAETTVRIVDSPIPEPPTPYHVVIKVEVAGCNPKDWKVPLWNSTEENSGDDAAGTIHAAGSAVTHLFQPGQRVAAFHQISERNGAFAEYAAAPAHTIIRIPDHVSFEEAATIPLAAATAGVGLFLQLDLPEPWNAGAVNGVRDNSALNPGPLIVYGAAAAIGAFAIKLAKRAGIGPIFCVAGRGSAFVEGLIDRDAGDLIVDYREGDDALVERLKKAARALPGSPPILYAFDAVSSVASSVNLSKVLGPGGQIAVCQPIIGDAIAKVPRSILLRRVLVSGAVHVQQPDFGAALFALLEDGLTQGWFKGHPSEVVPGGLGGIQKALENLKDGKASAVKYVFRIADTPK